MSYERDNIRNMRGYAWGEQPEAADTIKLNTNENPYPPSPQVDQALAALQGAQLRRYPQPTADPLRDAIAARHGLTREQVIVTHGGDEALRLALTTFVEVGSCFGMAEPSYSLYPVLAAIHDARVHRVPLASDWQLPGDTAAQLNQAGAQLTCLVNPHAPSGYLTDIQVLSDIAAQLQGVLLIDEAYADFIDPELHYASEQLLDRHDNVLILRTFSKGYSLAGMRLGYLLGNPGLINPMLGKTRDSYNVDLVSQHVGLAAITDQAYAAETWRQVRAQRELLQHNLGQLGLHCQPSQSNFLLASVSGGTSAALRIYQGLKAHNILVRYFDHPGLDDKLRISVGTAAENQALLNRLHTILEQHQAV